jgi:membrane protein insertase Oxa1/YidC/SpoIIIJ
MAIANNMMVYFMPVMIAVFAASLPAAVGVYWGVSTLYGVVQQLFVNKSGTKPKEEDSDVKVRVIEPKEDKPTT